MGTGMKILLSAYACEPGRGSEPGVGWNWALALAKRGHDVSVITRSNNREPIEVALASLQPYSNLHFYYYDLPTWVLKYKKTPGGVYWYYLLWQFGIVEVARKLHKTKQFQLAHHITFGVFRHPSFLWKLGVPLIFGPVGGGERTPQKLRKSFRYTSQIKELVREIANFIALLDPTVRACFRQSSLIITKTPETLSLIPMKERGKSLVSLEIGIETRSLKSAHKTSHIGLLFVGRFVYWKGGQLVIKAFAQCARNMPELHLTLVGKGPQKDEWVDLVAQLEVDQQVTFVDWVTQDTLSNLYAENDVFVFPSMHDSSGNVILEAMAQSLPVICLGLGGPAMIVNETCGRVIDVTEANEDLVVTRLARSIREVTTSTAMLQSLSDGAKNRAESFTWDGTVGKVYQHIEDSYPTWGAE
jgi:glycosyltransferase involved in cell wall biosynthesis